MRILIFTLIVIYYCFDASTHFAQENGGKNPIRKGISLDSIRLSDPFIFADSETKKYFMTGTGGKVWISTDLRLWEGPHEVVDTKGISWMGDAPMIWAAEIHKYNGEYYYFGTFTNPAIKIDTVYGRILDRRAVHILVADNPMGPYKSISQSDLLPADQSTLDGSLWIENEVPYLIFCHEWLQNQDGTVEAVAMKDDFATTIGGRKILFRASDSPWSRENTNNNEVRPNAVTDGPYLFRTGTNSLGMIWTSWVYDEYTQGVAYSTTGKLEGPWVQEKQPITPPNFGHGMIFKTFEGKNLMAIHSHKEVKGRYHRIPHLFEVDLSGPKIIIGNKY